MQLKPQDVLVLAKLLTLDARHSFNSLAVELGMSASEVHAATKRALQAQLLVPHPDGQGFTLHRQNLQEFLIHGLRYCFVPERGGLTRGIPTAHAAPPLVHELTPDSEPPPVWPHPEGPVRGQAFSPLYRSAPTAAGRDPRLYELLALLDAIRGGRARERAIAIQHLTQRLASHG